MAWRKRAEFTRTWQTELSNKIAEAKSDKFDAALEQLNKARLDLDAAHKAEMDFLGVCITQVEMRRVLVAKQKANEVPVASQSEAIVANAQGPSGEVSLAAV